MEAAEGKILDRADAIVTSLITCSTEENCDGCIYREMSFGCSSILMFASADLMQTMQSELERVQKERNAAVAYFKSYGCICCTDYETATNCKGCNPPMELPNFNWNGKTVCAMGQVCELVRALQSELARVQKERDAAIADLKAVDNCEMCKQTEEMPDCNSFCRTCIREDCLCNTCVRKSNWEWRGVKGD